MRLLIRDLNLDVLSSYPIATAYDKLAHPYYSYRGWHYSSRNYSSDYARRADVNINTLRCVSWNVSLRVVELLVALSLYMISFELY
jgi:hypothetical protein